MNKCIKFTCGVVVIAILIALIIVGLAYKSFGEPVEDEDTGELIQFWDIEVNKCYLIILGLFVCSLGVNIVGNKLPFLGFIVSFIPLWYCLKMFKDNILTKKPEYFIIIAVINVIGCLIATIQYLRHLRGLPADGEAEHYDEDDLPDYEIDDEGEDGVEGEKPL